MKALHKQYIIIDTIKDYLRGFCTGLSIGVFIWIISEIVKAI